MNRMRLGILACAAALAVACGQKGPLLLPDAQPHKKPIPKARPAGPPPSTTPVPASTPAPQPTIAPPTP